MVSDTSTVYSAKGRGRWLARSWKAARASAPRGRGGALDKFVQAWEVACSTSSGAGPPVPRRSPSLSRCLGVGEVCSTC